MPIYSTNDQAMQQIGRCAIITAFTPNFEADFKIFLDSIRRITKIPIIAIALDYSNAELEKLCDLDVQIIRFTSAELQPLQKIGSHWPKWYKPLFIKKAIKRANLTTALWLDVDIVVLDDLKPLFKQALQSFFVMNDYFDPKSCMNNTQLYVEYPTPIVNENEDVVLNSGVIGIMWPRDKEIINDWQSKIDIIANNHYLMDYVSLYDQGALLWSMRDLGILDKILQNPAWNHRAAKNCYEFETNHKWPIPHISRMGGNIIDEVKFDNPNVTIAHFAGAPKLSQLCEFNSEQPCQFMINKYRDEAPATRVFGIGIERAGTHSLAEMLRRSNRSENWVRHEFEPSLSYEALNKWQGNPYHTDELKKRLDFYNRQDTRFISEVNHRLSFFVPEIQETVPNAKFILLLRNPLALVRSRLLNFSGWNKELHRFAGCYQFDAHNLHIRFGSGSEDQNRYRLRPSVWDLNPIEMHVWEIVETLQFVLRDLRKLPKENYKIIWIEDFSEAWKQIEELIPSTIYWSEAKKWENIRFGARLPCSPETLKWVNDQITEHASFIIDSITEVLNEFNVMLNKPSS